MEQDAARLRPTDVERVPGNSGLARHMLGWAPMVPWEETLSSVLDDWRARVAAGE